MTQIAKTNISTSDPLTLCNGFALFPAIGTSRAGVSAAGNSGTLFDTNGALLFYRFSGNAGFSCFFGVCGPAYAIKMNLEGSAVNQSINLAVSNDELMAGFVMGLNVRLYFNLNVDEQQSTWVWDGWDSYLKTYWQNLINFSFDMTFDLIDMIFTIINLLLEEEGKKNTFIQKVDTWTPSLLGTWGMFDDVANCLVSNNGKMTATPTFTVPVDITSLIPPLDAFNTALKPFFSHFSMGPSIGIQVPVTVEMKKVKLDTVEYTNLTFGNGAVSGTTTGSAPDSPAKLAVGLDHTPGFDLSVGIFAQLNLLKLFNVGASISIPLLSLLNIKVTLGTYSNELSNTISKTSAKECSCGAGEDIEMVDVIFE
jgi:uncharacterized membrane protein